MTNSRSTLIQIIADLAIPLLGFFMWNWSLYFILLFLLLDAIAKDLSTFFKMRRLEKLGLGKLTNRTIQGIIVCGFATLLLVCFALITVYIQDPETNFAGEFWSFLSYEEWGIPQGAILLPLVFVMTKMELKMAFLHPGLYQHLTPKLVLKEHLAGRLLMIVGSAIVVGLLHFVKLSDIVVLITLLFGVVGFRLWALKGKPWPNLKR